jgi:hypothetical protein
VNSPTNCAASVSVFAGTNKIMRGCRIGNRVGTNIAGTFTTKNSQYKFTYISQSLWYLTDYSDFCTQSGESEIDSLIFT